MSFKSGVRRYVLGLFGGIPAPFQQEITVSPAPDRMTLPQARARIIELESELAAMTAEAERLEGINGEQADMIARWSKLWEDAINVQSRVVRRVFRLPNVLGRALQASNVSEGTVVSDGTAQFSIFGPDGPWLELRVTPFEVTDDGIKSRITVADTSTKQSPLTFELCNNGSGDLYASMLRELIGYGEFAKRNVEATPGILVEQINQELALSGDLVD